MAERAAATTPEIAFEIETGGHTRAELRMDGRAASRLFIVPFTLRVGAATVRMDGIGGVETPKEHRRRGYARQLLDATMRRMERGDAALSMLYGIPDFYPKFGYATAGPDHSIELAGPFDGAALPTGWRVRSFAAADLPALRRLYEQNTARGVGATVRSADRGPWVRLKSREERQSDDCRVVTGPDGQVRGYAWRPRWQWYVSNWERNDPEILLIAEAMAESSTAADALLAACRRWAVEESSRRPEPVKRLIFSLPPEGPVAAAAMYQRATLARRYQHCGGSMIRVLNPHRLLHSLQPELSARIQAARVCFAGSVRITTDLGDAVCRVRPEGATIEALDAPREGTRSEAGDGGEELVIRMPQTTLGRLALGAFPPGDLMDRLEEPPDDRARLLIETLFPLRHPHMYLPDRF